MRKTISKILESNELLEVARLAIEDVLVELRDSRISVGRNNGLVIKERDGSQSGTIRMSSETALSIGLRAILKYVEDKARIKKHKSEWKYYDTDYCGGG